MTIARTLSGDVIGQVTTLAAPAGSLVLLTSGRYVTVSLASVRLEEV